MSAADLLAPTARRLSTWRPRLLDVGPWLAPAALLVAGRAFPDSVPSLLSRASLLVLALGFVVAASRRPDRSLAALVAFMPFQVFVPSFLLATGVPRSLVRAVGGWRDLLGLAIVLAAFRYARRHGRRPGRVFVLGVAYVLLLGLYALVPQLFAADAPTDVDVRTIGWRSLAGFVVLLLACRELSFGRSARQLVVRALLLSSLVVTVGALWEAFDDDSWNRFAVETIRVNHYKAEILGIRVAQPNEVRVHGGEVGSDVVRASSVFGSPLTLGHYLLVPFALSIEKLLRGRTPGITALTVAYGAAIVLTQTRSAVLGAVIVVAGALRRSPGRSRAQRTRLALFVTAACIVAAPAIAEAGLTERFGDDTSNTQHRDGLWAAIDSVIERPIGYGIGTNAGTGQRFGSTGVFAENYYLQVAQESGVVGGALFVAFVVTVNRHLRRAADETADPAVAGIRSGVLAVCVAVAFLHTFNDVTLSWTVFGLAGLGLAATASASGARPGRPSTRSGRATLG